MSMNYATVGMFGCIPDWNIYIFLFLIYLEFLHYWVHCPFFVFFP